jgi:hypothetical protein
MRSVLLATALLAPALATAEVPSSLEITPFGGYRMGGQIDAEDTSIDIRLRDSSSVGLILNGRHRDNTEWEVLYSYQDTTARIESAQEATFTDVGFESQTAHFGGTYLFEGEKAIPYIALTIGGTRVRTSSPGGESDTFFSGSFGVGLKLFPNSRVGVRLEARGYGILVSSSSAIFCSTDPEISGCAIRLSGDIASQIETFAGLSFRF